jgi:DNA primase
VRRRPSDPAGRKRGATTRAGPRVRIRREDVDHVRERTRIEEVVGEHVTLKSAGVGSLKGLCPFHDEKTPSFHVRPQVGLWHCFGCGQGGDVISFVQEVDHLGFTDAVELLAARLGYQLHYEDDDGRGAARRDHVGQRQRLVEANRAAADYYAEQLGAAGDAVEARRFLAERGFDRDGSARFGVGFAPRTGDALLRHLRGRGFTEDDLVASGLAGRGHRGLYDRFRGRLVWPIRDVTSDVVGFGARRLFEDDRIEAKYLNTPETAVYKKSQVLYGVDLAKREIARERRAVVVEGYTDVMACHLSGVETAIATCGTAFGADHTRILRRLLGDDRSLGQGGTLGGQVVFTFDGDEAGRKAAVRAFEDDQRFVAQTFVAVAEQGMDPCELRQRYGPEAVRRLVEARQPLFEFVIRSTLAQLDLDTAEGRVQALRAAAPIVARIKDSALRPEYARRLAGWLGMDVEPVARAVAQAGRGTTVAATRGADLPDRHVAGARGGGSGPSARPPTEGRTSSGSPAPIGRGSGGSVRPAGWSRDGRSAPGGRPENWTGGRSDGVTERGRLLADADPATEGTSTWSAPDPRDPVARVEREALECLLQVPLLVPLDEAGHLSDAAFEVPAYRAVHQAIRAAGGVVRARELSGTAWTEAVHEQSPLAVAPLVTQLAVTPLPADTDEALARYAESVVLRLAEVEINRQIGMMRSRVQRLDPDDPAAAAAFADLLAAEARRRALRDRITGG